MTPATSTTHDLAVLPEGSTLHSVTATPAEASGRTALRVELTDAVTLQGVPHIDYVDMPTFVALPAAFENGTIEVDILSRLNGKGPPTPGPLPALPTASPAITSVLKPCTYAR